MMAHPIMPTPDTPPLIRSLLVESSCYDHAVGQVQLIETHISWVLLTGEFAYKIKKPVNMGFLDFSTLALRQQACDDEVRLSPPLKRFHQLPPCVLSFIRRP